jgi:D-beta-D-heptose 7-phosphate kinase / D-beta-D-heptose 1-phosphate adenosyltransferase
MNAIQKFLGLCDKKRKITIVGDCLLDLYYDVNAERVSPEFPIPVLRREDETPYHVCPGGAGNVAAQFRHFNIDARFIGLVNETSTFVLKDCGVDIGGCILIENIPIKKRYYQEEFPICRLDIEKKDYGLTIENLKQLQSQLFENYKKFSSDVVIFSDYNKGLFSDLGLGTDCWVNYYANPITIVDPKGGPVSRWKGCSVIKPNAKEAAELSGESDWRKQCAYFQKETACTACVITQGATGVVGTVMGNEFEYFPNKEIVASSVIGAGDCFVGFLAMALSYNMDILEAVEVAFHAGAIYVQRKHNKAVAPYEFTKFVKPEWLINRDFKLVFTNGCYDIIHEGHLSTLSFAKSKGDKLVVALDDDNSVKKLKGNTRPILPLEERKKIIANLEMVDFVVEFSGGNPYNIIQTIKPDVLVKGEDCQSPIGSDVVPEVYLAPLASGKSTTNIIEKIRKI